MGPSQCPVCFSRLEVRDVAPCYVCGGRPESVSRFDPAAGFTEFRLPGGPLLLLCRGCLLEEFMVPGGWGYQLVPGEKLPVDALQWVRNIEEVGLGRDKFCTTCNLRLAFARVAADGPRPAEPVAAVGRQVIGDSRRAGHRRR